jgi:hypothetical protein
MPKWWADKRLRKEALELKLGLRKRPSDVPHIPAGSPVDRELNKFQKWALWIAAGKNPQTRPKDIWKAVPDKMYWDVLTQYIKLHSTPPPQKPPIQPSLPPSKWKNTPWVVKHVHTSHGLRKDDGVWTIDQLIARAKTAKCQAIICQIGGDTPDPDWAENARALYKAGKAAGLRIGAWGRMDYVNWETVKAMIKSVLPLDGVLADIEGRCQDQALPEKLVKEFPNLPMGVIATGAIDQSLDGLSPPAVAQRWGDHFDFVGQDYHKADNPMTPDTGENFVYWRSTAKVTSGFRHLPEAKGRWHIPVVMPSAETCPPLEAHRAWLRDYTPHYGVWDGELVEANGEWGVFASI